MIELLEQGALSEGHGRALLLAEDHADRRSLARIAVEQGWSVRVTEERAREIGNGTANTGRTAGRERISSRAHPDQEQAAKDIADALADALGADVQVKPTRDGGYRAEMTFASPEEANELVGRLRGSPAA